MSNYTKDDIYERLSITDLIEERNALAEEEINHQLRKMTRRERRKAFRQAGIRTEGGREGSLSQKRGKR